MPLVIHGDIKSANIEVTPVGKALPAAVRRERPRGGVESGRLIFAGLTALGIVIWVLILFFNDPKITPLLPHVATAARQKVVVTVESAVTNSALRTVKVATQPALETRITDTKGVPMVFIPTGEFQMGSDNGYSDEKPVHTVFLDGFYMDVYEVTNARYAECVSFGACQPPIPGSSNTRSSYYDDAQFADYPVIYITWKMADAYCKWRGGSLPTEAQWEKAARGGLERMEYPWGNEQPVCEKGAQNGANFIGCGSNNDTEAVGSYSPNGYGVYDMAGNVWEWVWDWYSETYYGDQKSFENPFGPDSGDAHIFRGGAWYNNSNLLRVASRVRVVPTINRLKIGVRCASSP